jgi:hypothetical protein
MAAIADFVPIATVNFLVNRSADPKITDNYGSTALQLAEEAYENEPNFTRKKQRKEIVDLLKFHTTIKVKELSPVDFFNFLSKKNF